MKGLVIALLLIGAMSLTASSALAGGGSPDAPVNIRLSTKSFQGDPGDTITVSGSGAVPSLSVFVSLAPQADSAAGALVTEEVSPAADGTFSATLTIPADTADGIYAVRAEQFSARGNVLQYYWNAFTVGAGASGPLLPRSGATFSPSITSTATFALLLLAGLLGKGVYALTTVGKRRWE